MKSLNYETTSYLYDLNTFEKVKLENIFNYNYSTKLEADEYQKLNAQNILTNKAIRDLAFKVEGWQLLENTDQESCNYFKIDIWNTSNWILTDNGIIFYPYFPLISKTLCERPFLIPIAELNRYKKQSFTYSLGLN